MNTPPELSPKARLANSRSAMITLMQQEHPLLQRVQPIIASYATAHPLQTLALAAGAGAAVVVLKPWRLLTFSLLLDVIRARR